MRRERIVRRERIARIIRNAWVRHRFLLLPLWSQRAAAPSVPVRPAENAIIFRNLDLNCPGRRAVIRPARTRARANHFLIRQARNSGMIKTTLMALIFLSMADIVIADGKYSDSAGRMATGIWYNFVGR
jgi:hypothetical protein